MARRNQFDPLASVPQPRWLTVRMMHGEVIESLELAPGSDLRGALAAKAEELRAAGWEPETDAQWAVFFARRGAERIEVSTSHSAPGAPTSGPGFFRRG